MLKIVGKVRCDQIGRLLEILGNIFYYQKCPKYLVTFWAFVKALLLSQTG